MSDIRRSILCDAAVIIATDRAARPDDFAKKAESFEESLPEGKKCPFCPGNEHMTPKELALIQEPGRSSWSLRCFPNLYPAATNDERSHFVVEHPESNSIVNAHGSHEIIVETEGHHEHMAAIPVWKLHNLLHTCCDRTKAIYEDRDIGYVQVFKNYAKIAGASQPHPHWQIIALPFVPEKILNRLGNCYRHKAQYDKDAFQEAIDVAEKYKLVVEYSKHFLCYCPYESLVPFEMTIMPQQSVARLEDSRAEFQELAIMLSRTFQRLAIVMDNKLPPYNMWLEEAPDHLYQTPENFFRWRWRIFPRLTIAAGFEFASGCYINPLPPERAAEALHKVKF